MGFSIFLFVIIITIMFIIMAPSEIYRINEYNYRINESNSYGL